MKICSKHLLIVLNILFFVLGLGVLVLGTWISVDKTSLFDLVSNSTSEETPTKDETIVKTEIDYYFTFASLVIIGTGAFIVLLSLVGCCGAIKESKCLLITYALVVILITLVQSIGIILSAVYQENLKDHISKAFAPVIQQYGNDPFTTQVWDLKMESLECCGVNGYGDFEALKISTNISSICCNKNSDECTSETISQNKNDKNK